jgi:hypothetical protein
MEISSMKRDNMSARAAFACAATMAAVICGVSATPAAAQSCSQEANNICGFVWNDANNNGVQDPGESGIENVTVTFTATDGSGDTYPAITGPCVGPDASEFTCGVYQAFLPAGDYDVSINPTSIDQGTVASPPASPDATPDTDSDGVPDGGNGVSVAHDVYVDGSSLKDVDFGFYTAPPALQVGTGTPGYWKNHPDDWPVSSVMIGGKPYTAAEAKGIMGKVSKDKTITMFSSLLAAKLNLLNGTTPDCIIGDIEKADKWMKDHPVGSNVAGASAAWAEGEPWHKAMDAYNNGLMCAPHRN